MSLANVFDRKAPPARTNERTDGRGEKPYCIRCVDSERFNLGDGFNKRVEGERDYCQVRGWKQIPNCESTLFLFHYQQWKNKFGDLTGPENAIIGSNGTRAIFEKMMAQTTIAMTCIKLTSSRSYVITYGDGNQGLFL